MSTPANEEPASPIEKRGASKFLDRMKTVLKRKDGSKRWSFSGKGTASAATASTAAGQSTSVAPKPTAEKIEEPTPATVPVESKEVPTKIMRSQIQAERTRKLGERFALTVEPYEWESKEDKEAFRIEKPIRVRIHRSCHRCNTTYGGNKVCVQCQHTRCKNCPRFPPKREKKDKGKEKEEKENVLPHDYIEPDSYWNLWKDDLKLTMPSKRPGGQPLVRKKPKQRVRRNCHECQALFLGGAKTCPGCGHIRCTDCPRDPAKKKRYPDGYPGDAFSTNTSLPVKYSCSKCSKVFPAVPHPDSEEGRALAASGAEPQKCVRCGHDRCPNCPRAPPQRVDNPEPDPEVLKSLEAKLAALNVSSGA